jgi:hypothetical protein
MKLLLNNSGVNVSYELEKNKENNEEELKLIKSRLINL